MARLVPLQRDFNRMVQDQPRYGLPKGSAWNLQDYIPDLTANLDKRGGWKYASNDISAASSSATYINTVAYAPFSASAKLCYMTDNNKFGTIATNLTVTQVATTGVQSLQRPVFFGDKLVIFANDGTTAPKYYDGTTFGNLAGSPPAGKYGAAWKNYLLNCNVSANKNRIRFSDEGDPTVWDSSSWLDVLLPITGVAALPNVALVFMETHTARLRGNTPPPGGDMVKDDPVFNIGCTDARSIAVDGPRAIFANPSGVFVTNGTTLPEDLTQAAGLQRHWQANLASYTSSWIIAAGIYRHKYYVSIMNGSSFVDCYVFDPVARTGYRLTNIKATCWAPSRQVSEELYFASRAAPRVNSISSMYSPAGGVKNDEDGTAVTPVLETPFYMDQKGSKDRWKEIYTHYDLRDASSDNPIITVSYQSDPSGSYTALSTTLAETTADTRVRVPLRLKAFGMGFKLAQTNASATTKIVALEADSHMREDSSLS